MVLSNRKTHETVPYGITITQDCQIKYYQDSGKTIITLRDHVSTRANGHQHTRTDAI